MKNLVDDLGIELPSEPAFEPITESMDIEIQRARDADRLRRWQPNPPYRCICGLKFETAEARLAHGRTHPRDNQGRTLAMNAEQLTAFLGSAGPRRRSEEPGET